jgi:hypothetical protein
MGIQSIYDLNSTLETAKYTKHITVKSTFNKRIVLYIVYEGQRKNVEYCSCILQLIITSTTVIAGGGWMDVASLTFG